MVTPGLDERPEKVERFGGERAGLAHPGEIRRTVQPDLAAAPGNVLRRGNECGRCGRCHPFAAHRLSRYKYALRRAEDKACRPPFGSAMDFPGKIGRRDFDMSEPTNVTAAVLVIGDEILSGRTKDRNLGYIAEYLARLGVDVREARIVPDVEEEIVAALERAARPLRLCGDDRRHRPDPRRHHRGRGRPRLRGFDRRGSARARDHAGALRARRPDPGPAADVPHSRPARNSSKTRSRRRRGFASATCSCWRACPRSCRRCSISPSSR